MDSSKLHTFIGFSIKTGKYKIGLNAVNTLKRADLVLVCPSASLNSKKEALKLSTRFKAPLFLTKEKLEDLTHRENAKIMAIFDKKLTRAILENCRDLLENFNQERTDG